MLLLAPNGSSLIKGVRKEHGTLLTSGFATTMSTFTSNSQLREYFYLGSGHPLKQYPQGVPDGE
jgi:hypothetical protein